jgi:hypothetical protein
MQQPSPVDRIRPEFLRDLTVVIYWASDNGDPLLAFVAGMLLDLIEGTAGSDVLAASRPLGASPGVE